MEGNIFTFCLPDIGEGVVEGEVIEWLKKVGETVKQDEPVVTVMTDKATVELPAPYPGTIVKQYYKPGEISIKDKPLYDIQLAAGASISPSDKQSHASKQKKDSVKSTPRPALIPNPVTGKCAGKALATPKVRRTAHEWGIDLESVTGSGKEGRVTEEDLQKVSARNPAAVPHGVPLDGDEEHPLIGVRGLMARRMEQTRIPQFSYFEHADANRLVAMRQKFKSRATTEGINLSYMPFIIRALSLTIIKYPVLNASIDMQAGKVIIHKKQNIGIAVASLQGLIVPILKDVETMGLNEVIRAYEELKKKAQNGKFSSTDMKDGTITISNFGVLGGEGLWATPMISAPEVAILAVARMRETPVVRNHEIVVRELLPLSWSFDHRVIDGDLAAKISAHYCTLLKDPVALL